MIASADRLGGVLTACSSSGVSNDWLRISTVSGGVGCQGSTTGQVTVRCEARDARGVGKERTSAPAGVPTCEPAASIAASIAPAVSALTPALIVWSSTASLVAGGTGTCKQLCKECDGAAT